MNDFELDQLLDDAMRVEDVPDLWLRASQSVSAGPSWRELRWAGAVAMAVLFVCMAAPQKAASVGSRWEPIAYKSRLRAHSGASPHDMFSKLVF